jgi:hypothetical protein
MKRDKLFAAFLIILISATWFTPYYILYKNNYESFRIHLGPIEFLATDLFGFFGFFMLYALIYLVIKIAGDEEKAKTANYVAKTDSVLKKFSDIVPKTFQFLEWLIIIGAFEAAAKRTSSLSLGVIYAGSMGLIVMYLSTLFLPLLRQLILRPKLKFFYIILLIIGIFIASLVLSGITQLIADFVLDLVS